MSALFVHQSPTLPQKIDSHEGLVLVQRGGRCTCRQNEYLCQTTTIYTGFWAICC